MMDEINFPFYSTSKKDHKSKKSSGFISQNPQVKDIRTPRSSQLLAVPLSTADQQLQSQTQNVARNSFCDFLSERKQFYGNDDSSGSSASSTASPNYSTKHRARSQRSLSTSDSIVSINPFRRQRSKVSLHLKSHRSNHGIASQLSEGIVNYTPLSKNQRRSKVSSVLLPKIIDSDPPLTSTSYNDENEHYIIKENMNFTNRYIFKKILGKGTFANVASAYDKATNKIIAIKIVRSIPKYYDAGLIELKILSTILKNDLKNLNHCIQLEQCFEYRNHIVMIMPILDLSISDFLKFNKFNPFPGSHIQSIIKQLLRSVCFLHDLNIIHTDIKPENILLHSSTYNKMSNNNRHTPLLSTSKSSIKVLKDTTITLIDFGSAIFNTDRHPTIVSTRHYRAPEIILDIGWDNKCDIWSIGCLFVELLTGNILIGSHDNEGCLKSMETILSCKIDLNMINQCKEKNKSLSKELFKSSKNNNNYEINFPNEKTSIKSINLFKNCNSLELIFLNLNLNVLSFENNEKKIFYSFMFDLIKRMLMIDPKKRITAKEALEHPFFKVAIYDIGIKSRDLDKI